MTDSRYRDPAYAARYLEAEWGDIVLKHATFPDGHSEPFMFQDRNVAFYTNVVQMLKENLQRAPDFRFARMADFGCASGRLVREVCEAFPDVAEVVGYEPSSVLCGLARQMVLGDALPEQLPTSDQPSGSFRNFSVTPEFLDAIRKSPASDRASPSLSYGTTISNGINTLETKFGAYGTTFV